MWKDWLAFSRREQYGIVFLAFLVVLFLGLRIMLPRWAAPRQVEFRIDPSVAFSDQEQVSDQNKKDAVEPPEKIKQLPAFDPNNVSVTQLYEMGVAPYAIVNWMKYLEAGGKFEERRDILNVYGLDSALAVRLEASANFHSTGSRGVEKYGAQESGPEGDIPEKNSGETDSEYPIAADDDLTVPSEKSEEPDKIILEINKAGPEDFKKLKGIGDVYSGRIVAFREALGGFYTIEQLLEVYGISRELFERIQKQIKINSAPYRKIFVNRASVRKLKKHPYLDFYQAREIVEYRRENGDILEGEIIRSFSSFSGEQLEKVLPYLTFVSQDEGNLTKN